MNNFLRILSAPDNIPIVAMVIILCVVIYVAYKQAMENDKLLEESKFDEMAERMRF